MPKTELGKQVEAEWSASAKADLKNDSEKLTKVSREALRSVIIKIAKTHPACNTTELTTLEAEQRGVDAQDLSDAVSVWVFLWRNTEGVSPQAVTTDLISLGLISNDVGDLLAELLTLAEPFREAALAASKNLRIGAPLFSDLHGTVDIRCRFHKTDEAINNNHFPNELVDAQQVIMANLTIRKPDDEEAVVSFLMDEADLSYMKRFVRNMEKELELSKGLLARS